MWVGPTDDMDCFVRRLNYALIDFLKCDDGGGGFWNADNILYKGL